MARILIAEDDDFLRSILVDLLQSEGHTIMEAPHGKAAVEMMNTYDFDIVISDIQMPGMNGIELLTWSIQNKPTPFIVMSAFSTLLETQSAMDLGAKNFMNKPFRPADLLKNIKHILETSSL